MAADWDAQAQAETETQAARALAVGSSRGFEPLTWTDQHWRRPPIHFGQWGSGIEFSACKKGEIADNDGFRQIDRFYWMKIGWSVVVEAPWSFALHGCIDQRR
jgi:hypothetical protein